MGFVPKERFCQLVFSGCAGGAEHRSTGPLGGSSHGSTHAATSLISPAEAKLSSPHPFPHSWGGGWNSLRPTSTPGPRAAKAGLHLPLGAAERR